ncbi:UNVERIFIED_CONTAM: N-acetyltransferase, partial [Bacillus amyloliquefaciens DSM 7 = ATCC 23350]
GMRIVPVCKMVASYVDKHDEYNDIVDPVSDDVEQWLANR